MTPRTAARQASLSITNSWTLLKLMSIISVMPSNHLILCHSLLFLPSIFPSIRAFSSPVVTAEFSKFAGIFSAALSQHHLSGLQMVIAAMKLKDAYSLKEKL